MNFNKFYEIIKESISFSDLPKTMDGYYGFWISPSGEVDLVRGFQDHSTEAKKIILNNEIYRKKYMDYAMYPQYDKTEADLKSASAYDFKDFLYVSLKYMRVAKARGVNMFFASTQKAPTPKQVSTLKDLGMIYDYQTHFEYF